MAVAGAVSVAMAVGVTVAGGLGDRLEEPAEPQPHFGGGGRLARVAAAEDHVLHLVAAEALGALLAHHPCDGVGDVALAAAVGSDNRGDALIEGEFRSIGERFETVNLEPLQAHAWYPNPHRKTLRVSEDWLGFNQTNRPILRTLVFTNAVETAPRFETVASVTRPSYSDKRQTAAAISWGCCPSMRLRLIRAC